MTLKEKAEEAWNDYEYKEGNLYSNCFKDGFKQGAKIADDYAIEFAEWCDDNYFKNGKGNSNWSASMDWDDNEKFTTKELLEIFKKEEGL